jgi:hypothetical protein
MPFLVCGPTPLLKHKGVHYESSTEDGLLTLEGLVLINAAFHFFRSDGFAMLIAGGFFGIVMLILLLVSGGLYLHKRDEC